MSILYLPDSILKSTRPLQPDSLQDVWKLIYDGLISFGNGRSEVPRDVYLRANHADQFDRIIAKPAIIDGIAGIKWISSARSNKKHGIPRASGLLILNDINTGQVYAILDAVRISNIRTAAVSMLFLTEFRSEFRRAVIFGAGIHGREHLRQLLVGVERNLFPNLEEICVYDCNLEAAKSLVVDSELPLTVLKDASSCFDLHTAVIICTDALIPHIGLDHIIAKRGLTIVHVSLRDLTPEAIGEMDHCIVDSGEHVASAGTSVDLAIQAGLIALEDCLGLPSLLIDKRANGTNPFRTDDNVSFNPMGLGIHDLKLGRAVFDAAVSEGVGITLPGS